ncbi:hypothetical protein N665_0309s0047 [Sinapis alba]|nr:hypothetical protein N665_0309s0047 [Sinapis alba]
MNVTTFRLHRLHSPVKRDYATPKHSIRLIVFQALATGVCKMANSQILLADLKAGRCSNTAEVRLLRFWEARNVRKGGELMSIDMLFVDENSTLTQGSISANRQLRFRERLIEGSLYTLSGFDVTRNNPNFRLSDAPLSIRFNEGTEFVEKKTEPVRPIPTEVFRFMPYTQLISLANTGKQLPDIMGELNAIRSTITDCIPGAQRVMLTLRLESGENVCVSMFDSKALAFHTKLDSYGKEPKIVIVTSVNPKIVGGRLFLNSTSGTHLYFDTETDAGNAVFSTLAVNAADPGESSSKVVHAQKIEPMTVHELNQFINPADSQIIEFLCTAKVTGIQLEDGWCYIGCSECSKKLVREVSSFTCVSCNETNAIASLRYRVTMSVSDNTDTAAFLAFDMEMAKLINIKASEVAQIVGIGVSASVDTEIPQSIADIVGRTYTFQLKLTDFNFTSKHQTFTVSRIFPERALAPMPSFAITEGTTIPDATVNQTCCGAEETTAFDSSTAKRPLMAEAQVPIGETGRKKAHLE